MKKAMEVRAAYAAQRGGAASSLPTEQLKAVGDAYGTDLNSLLK